ncbi:hypothetical protein [Microbacterium gorillae]|uniref:hypothetical protein n=1 Tax=Microbacterium gorillae TaxID=1231063 RepID=UPI003D982F29
MIVPHSLILNPAAARREAHDAVGHVRQLFVGMLWGLGLSVTALMAGLCIRSILIILVASSAVLAEAIAAAWAWRQIPRRAREWYPDLFEDRTLLDRYPEAAAADEDDCWTAASLERRLRLVGERRRHPEVAAFLRADAPLVRDQAAEPRER